MAQKKKPPIQQQPSLRNLAAGDVLFREGEVGDFAYQVVKGKIEVCKFNGDEYVTLSILEKNALFGEMALIDKQPRSAMARAVDEAVVKEIDKEALLGYLKNSPQTAFNMMQQLASYARNASKIRRKPCLFRGQRESGELRFDCACTSGSKLGPSKKGD